MGNAGRWAGLGAREGSKGEGVEEDVVSGMEDVVASVRVCSQMVEGLIKHLIQRRFTGFAMTGELIS